MSISLAGVPAKQYVGTPYSIAVQLGGQSGRAVPLHFDWGTYGAPALPELVVNVNLVGSNQGIILDRIRSVYIDNLGSNAEILIQFPDTLYTVTAAPFSAGWYPVLTNVPQFSVLAVGLFTPIPTCEIYVSNLAFVPYTDYQIAHEISLWKASDKIYRTSTGQRGFATPALGDNSFNTRQNISLINQVPLPPVLDGQQIVFTQIFAYLIAPVIAGLPEFSIFGDVSGNIINFSGTQEGIVMDARGNLIFYGPDQMYVHVSQPTTSGFLQWFIAFTLSNIS